jgi:hypothetical protein
MPVVARDIPNPRIRKYYSDHDNPAQKTKALWLWWNQLPTPMKEIVEAHVYREWPVLLDPIDDKEWKYIDKIIGVAPVQGDHDFVDMYGAGDYKIYLNVNPAAAPRRTLAEAWVKCSHDFTKYPPSDNRVINVDNISQTDPANKAYVGWLRSQGKLKDEVKEAKEKEEMATATQGLTEVLSKSLDRGDRLMEKLIEERTAEPVIPPDPPPSPQEVISEQLSIFKSLKDLVPTADPMEMMKQVVATAQLLVQKDGNADLKPLMDEISKLREESRATEREFFRTQLSDIKEQLRAAKETPPAPNVLLPDGSNLQAIVEKAVAKAVDDGLGDSTWWVEPLKTLIPVAMPPLMFGLQRLFTPAPTPQVPLPPQNYQAGAPVMQPQLPPVAQQPTQPAPQAQQQDPQAIAVQQLLVAISGPVVDFLSRDEGGDDFADAVLAEHGKRGFNLISGFSAEDMTNVLYVFPMTAPNMIQFPRDKVLKFATDFKAYTPEAYEKKLEARERGGAA